MQCLSAQVIAGFNVDAKQGLTDSQVLAVRLWLMVALSAAHRVAQARGVYGRNELAPEPGTPLWKLVLKQFDDLLVKILIVAAVVDLIIALVSGESGAGYAWCQLLFSHATWHILHSVFVEPSVIVLILIANGASCRCTHPSWFTSLAHCSNRWRHHRNQSGKGHRVVEGV